MRDELASIDMHGRPEGADRSAERALSSVHNARPLRGLRLGLDPKYTAAPKRTEAAFQASRLGAVR